MSLLDKLLGRRPRTATTIGAELSARKAELSAAKARMASAAVKRAAALDAQDAAALKAVDDEAAADGRTAELAAHAIAALAAAHAEQIKIEEREQFRADLASAEREAVALTAAIQAEYPEAAKRIAGLLTRIVEHHAKADRLRDRGRTLGEAVTVPLGVEGFRAGPRRWKAVWPRPDGGVFQGAPEDAPRGSIRWVNGEPVAAHEGVTVEARPIDCPPPLAESISHIPGLYYGDPPIFYNAKPVALPPRMPV